MRNKINSLFLFFLCSYNVFSNDSWQKIDQLTPQQEQNLLALSKLYGYTRYFYPNQVVEKEFEQLDWYKLLVIGIREVIDAESEEVLKSKLMTLFSPIVPELSFENKNTLPPVSNKTPFYAREHLGYGARPVENIFYDRIKTFSETDQFIPVPDSMYCLPLNDRLDIYFPLALTRECQNILGIKQIKKQLGKITFKLLPISSGKAIFKHLSGKKVKKEFAFLFDPGFRIADIMIRWNIIQHFYPYYTEDSLTSIWEDNLTLSMNEAVSCDNQSEYYDIIRKCLAKVKDSHIVLEGNAYVGGHIMARLNFWIPDLELNRCSDTIFINQVPDSLKNILQTGDRLISVNNIEINSLIKKKWDLIPSSTVQGKYEALVLNQLLGSLKEDSLFTLEFETKDNKKVKINTKSDQINPSPSSDITYPYFVSDLGNGIFHVNLVFHNKKEANLQFQSKISEMKNAKGIIIDVRGYPNYHILDSLLGYFSKDPILWGDFRRPVYRFPNQKNVEYTKHIDEYLPCPNEYFDVPMCILINSKAMSYAESVIDALKRNTKATLIGEPTIGTNGDISSMQLPVFNFLLSMVKDFSSYHGKGIEPDIHVSMNMEAIRNKNDLQLNAAIKYLNEIKE